MAHMVRFHPQWRGLARFRDLEHQQPSFVRRLAYTIPSYLHAFSGFCGTLGRLLRRRYSVSEDKLASAIGDDDDDDVYLRLPGRNHYAHFQRLRRRLTQHLC